MVECESPVLENGRPVSGMKEKLTYLSMVVFECVKGFYLNGSKAVFCGGNNTWEPEMPKCIKGTNVGLFLLFFLGFISLTLNISDTE